MAVINYDQWMKDTASLLSSRGTELKAVDAAFLTYEKLGTGSALDALRTAFNTWKRSKGPGDAWRKSDRNSRRACDKLQGLCDGKGDDDSAFSMGSVPDFMHEELINARLGVLYLFSRLSVTPGFFKMILEGGLDIAGQAMEIGGASEPSKDIFGKVTDYGGKSGGIGFLGDQANKLEGKMFKPVAPKNVYLPVGIAPSIKIVTAQEVQRQADAADRLANMTNVGKIRSKLQEWFDMLVEKVKEVIRQKFGTVSGISGTIKSLVKGIVTLVAAKAAPFVGGALDLAAGLGKTIDAAVTRFRTWKEGRDVEVGQGHPTTIVNSITRAMNMALFEGLWATLKGAGALAMDIVGFGAGGVVNLIISCGEMLIKFIWRLVETVRFNMFCGEARGYWDNSSSLDALHRKPFAFSEWYRKTALNMPLVAVLTLNTGICGDKMRYLSMFKSGGINQISTNEFQAGVRFLDNLKPWGSKYIDDAGFAMRSANDPLVDALVNQFATSHSREQTIFDKVISVVTA